MKATRWLGTGLAMAMALAVTGGRADAQRAAPNGLSDPRARVVVALLPFQVHGPAELSYLGTAIPDLLASRLVTLTPAEQGAVAAALERRRPAAVTEAVAREVGRESGAQFAVLGTLTAIGERLSLDARILPVTSGRAATVFVQGEGFDSLLPKLSALALEIDKGISGVQAFLGAEEPSPGSGPRETPSKGPDLLFPRPGGTRTF